MSESIASREPTQRTIVAFDTETALIAPGKLAPELVCVTWQLPGEPAQLAHHTTAHSVIKGWLDNGYTIVGHNVAFDVAVIIARYPDLLEGFFRAYEEDRVTDTKLRQQLLDIAAGQFRGALDAKGKWHGHDYTLETTARRTSGMRLQKDAWRLSYGHFLNAPLEQWPDVARGLQDRARAELATLLSLPKKPAVKARIAALESLITSDSEQCVRYPLDDARATLAAYQTQAKHEQYLDDQYRQARAAFALHLSSCWGIRTDAASVAALRNEVENELAELELELQRAGFVRENGTRDIAAIARHMVAVCKDSGRPLRRTASHTDACTEDDCHVALDSDACKAVGDVPGGEVLEDYARLSTVKKVLSNDVALLERGTITPVQPSYGLAETGRATCTNPNLQNQSKREGIRECFVPREGRVFAQCDYPQLELYTLAQTCVSWFGASRLAEALNAGLDPHLEMAASILGITYEEAKARKGEPEVKDARQLSKVANFGLPGGLGITKLITFAKKSYGIELSQARAQQLKADWYEAWPEMRAYHERISASVDAKTSAVRMVSLFTNRHRGGMYYCSACNSPFQGLGADCAKQAAWLITQACYVDRASSLYGARMVAFIHDEFIVEVDDNERAHEAAQALADQMAQGANTYLPDVPMVRSRLEPLLMRKWSKKAEPLLVNGRLVPWQ